MRTFKLTLAYDGTDYIGWQRQAAGASIQGLLEEALGRLGGGPVTVTGAGRTDAGVHALGQVASVHLDSAMQPTRVLRALNALLPAAVRVLAVQDVTADFHARYSALAKSYEYRIVNAQVVSPFDRLYAWHVERPLDVDRMAVAAPLLEGRHDFVAFQSAGGSVATTVRTVWRSTLRVVTIDDGGVPSRRIVYEIAADGFLRHMVRTIVGSLVELGCGRRDVEWFRGLLTAGDRRRAGPAAPAHGLFLMLVAYEPGSSDGREGG